MHAEILNVMGTLLLLWKLALPILKVIGIVVGVIAALIVVGVIVLCVAIGSSTDNFFR